MGDLKLDRRQLDVLVRVKAMAVLAVKIRAAARAALGLEFHGARGSQCLLLTARMAFLSALGMFALFTLSLRALERASSVASARSSALRSR